MRKRNIFMQNYQTYLFGNPSCLVHVLVFWHFALTKVIITSMSQDGGLTITCSFHEKGVGVGVHSPVIGGGEDTGVEGFEP